MSYNQGLLFWLHDPNYIDVLEKMFCHSKHRLVKVSGSRASPCNCNCSTPSAYTCTEGGSSTVENPTYCANTRLASSADKFFEEMQEMQEGQCCQLFVLSLSKALFAFSECLLSPLKNIQHLNLDFYQHLNLFFWIPFICFN